jgi:hypothetical protein
MPDGLPAPPIPADHNAYRVDCTVRIPVDRTTAFCGDEGDGFCTHRRSEIVIFPPELNPNLVPMTTGAHVPTEAELDADAAGRVTTFVREGLRFTYRDCRPTAVCTAHRITSSLDQRIIETTRDAKANIPCPMVSLIRTEDVLQGFTNLNRATCIDPPNRPGCELAAPLCVCWPPSFDPPLTPPDGLLSGLFGRHSVGEITSGVARISIGGNPELKTAVRGTFSLTGGPCPRTSCDVGVSVSFRAGDVVSGSDTLTDITLVGAGESPGASLDSGGKGAFAAGRFHMTVGATGRGTFAGIPISGSQAFFVSNSDPVEVAIEWNENKFTIEGSLRMVTAPTPGAPTALSVALYASGRLLNRPPMSDAGLKQIEECRSPEGTLISLRGSATDMDGDVMSQLWTRDPAGIAEVVGSGPTLTLQQALGTQTYSFQVIDTFLQGDTSGLTVTVDDTVPPAVREPLIDVPCGWGGTSRKPADEKLCVRLVGKAEDQCSARVEMIVRSVQPFLGCTGRALGPPQQENCIRVDPKYRGRNMSRIVYIMRYVARDESGNESSLQTVSFRVLPVGDSSRCQTGVDEEPLWRRWLWSLFGRRMPTMPNARTVELVPCNADRP